MSEQDAAAAGRLMEVNHPETLREVTDAFNRYEIALIANDVETLDQLFLPSAETIRYGIAENLYGIEAIRAFRKGRSPQGLSRTLEQTVITSYGRDLAIGATLFHRANAPGRVGRQMQTWVRTPDGWRVAAAHVSIIDEPV